LLSQGVPGHALTWMDARINGIPVTPRTGKPVEVNALWINALDVLAELQTRAGRDAGSIRRRQAHATEAFLRRYPMPGGGLRDLVAPDSALVRPNQLFAYALPAGPLRGQPLPVVVHGLLTPLGLRTLAADAPGYRGRHRGGPASR